MVINNIRNTATAITTSDSCFSPSVAVFFIYMVLGGVFLFCAGRVATWGNYAFLLFGSAATDGVLECEHKSSLFRKVTTTEFTADLLHSVMLLGIVT